MNKPISMYINGKAVQTAYLNGELWFSARPSRDIKFDIDPLEHISGDNNNYTIVSDASTQSWYITVDESASTGWPSGGFYTVGIYYSSVDNGTTDVTTIGPNQIQVFVKSNSETEQCQFKVTLKINADNDYQQWIRELTFVVQAKTEDQPDDGGDDTPITIPKPTFNNDGKLIAMPVDSGGETQLLSYQTIELNLTGDMPSAEELYSGTLDEDNPDVFIEGNNITWVVGGIAAHDVTISCPSGYIWDDGTSSVVFTCETVVPDGVKIDHIEYTCTDSSLEDTVDYNINVFYVSTYNTEAIDSTLDVQTFGGTCVAGDIITGTIQDSWAHSTEWSCEIVPK